MTLPTPNLGPGPGAQGGYEPPSAPPRTVQPARFERLRAKLWLGKRRCRSCQAWCWEAAQRQIARDPVFRMAAGWLSPTQLAATMDPNRAAEEGRVDEAGQPLDLPDPVLGRPVGWEEFGACSQHQELRHAEDVCEAWR